MVKTHKEFGLVWTGKEIQCEQVELKIKELDYYPTLRQLHKETKHMISKQDLKAIINYFLEENKIIINKGEIVWIHNPGLVAQIEKRGLVVF